MRSRSGRSPSYYANDRLQAHAKGREAAAKGYPVDNNPYPAGPAQSFSTKYNHMAAMHKAWRDGWRSVAENPEQGTEGII